MAASAEPVDDLPDRGAGLRRAIRPASRRSPRRSCRSSPIISSSSSRATRFTVAEPQEFFALLVFLVVAVLTGLLAGRVRDQSRSVRDNARDHRSRSMNCRANCPARAGLDDILLGGDHLSAQDARRALRRDAAAGGRRTEPRRRLAADRRAGRRRDRRRALGLRQGGAGRLANRHPAQRALPVPSAAHAARRRSASAAFEPARPLASHLARRRARAQPHARTDRHRHRPLAAGRASRCKRRRWRRTKSCARRCSPRFRTICARRSPRSPARSRPCGNSATRWPPDKRARPARLDRGGGGAADPLRRQSARHVAHRSGRAQAAARLSSTSPRSCAPRSSARARSSPTRRSTTSLARDLPSIRGDANLLEQVLFNLLDNAQKYGGGGGGDRPCAASRRRRPALGHRRRARRQARRPRAHLREILPGRARGRPQGRHRARPVDLPRAGRGDGRRRSTPKARRRAAAARASSSPAGRRGAAEAPAPT